MERTLILRTFPLIGAATRTKVFVDGNYVYSCLDKLVQKV